MNQVDVDTMLATLDAIRDTAEVMREAMVWLTWGLGMMSGLTVWRIIQEAMSDAHNGFFGGDGQATVE